MARRKRVKVKRSNRKTAIRQVKVELIVERKGRSVKKPFEACLALGRQIHCARGKNPRQATRNVLFATARGVGRRSGAFAGV